MKFVTIALLLMLAGCVSIAKVETGDRVIGERMTITLEGEWNHLNAPGMGPAQTWTMEGLPVDELLLYSGLKAGQAIHAEDGGSGGATRKVFTFRAGMQPDEIAALFEGMLTRDGSRFRLTKLEPATFGGIRGSRFEFSLTRKVDNVQLSGVAYSAISKDELFAIVYMAPQLAFFQRHIASVEQISRSARIRE